MYLEEFGARETDQQHGRVLGEVGHVLEAVQQRRGRPMQVLDDHDDGAVAGQVLEQLAYRPEGLLGSAIGLGPPQGGGDLAGELLGLLVAGEQGGQLSLCSLKGVVTRDPGRLANHLGHRPVGDALAVGQAAATQDHGTFADACERLVHQP
jgi:hypothetical protein